MYMLRQLQEDTGKTIPRMALFMLSMFGNSVARGFPVSNNLIFSQIVGLIVPILAFAGLTVAWRRNLFFNRGLLRARLLLFTFLTAAFVCVGRVWRGDVQPPTPRYTTFGTLCVISVIVSLYSGFSGCQGNLIDLDFRSVGATCFRGSKVCWWEFTFASRALAGPMDMPLWKNGGSLAGMLERDCIFSENFPPMRDPTSSVAGKIWWRRCREFGKLGMLKPLEPMIRISALGREITSDGSKRGRFDALIPRGMDGWRHAELHCPSAGARRTLQSLACRTPPANGAGSSHPAQSSEVSSKEHCHGSEFLAISAPQKRGEWRWTFRMMPLARCKLESCEHGRWIFLGTSSTPLPDSQPFSAITEAPAAQQTEITPL